MAQFRFLNLEPQGKRLNDCVTRAISFATDLPYSEVRKKLFFTSKLLQCESKLCPTCYSFLIQEVLGGVMRDCNNMTVGEFVDRNPKGTYLIRIEGHLTTAQDNCVYDTWDCRDKMCDIAWKM